MRVFRRRTPLLAFVAYAGLYVGAAAAQYTPDPLQQNAADPNAPKRPLTPEEQRQKEIDKYDPLKKRDTSNSDRPVDAGASVAPAPAPRQNTDLDTGQRSAQPLPGSVADTSSLLPARPGGDGPQVVDDSGTLNAQTYTGPAVLSRSYTIARPTTPKELKWSWTVSSSEVYQSGLVTGTSSTAATTGAAFGTATTFGFSGRHFWKKDQVGLTYGLNYSNYFGSNAYSGSNQHLSVDYGHEFSRHLSFNLVENGSILSSNYSLENPLTIPGVSAANLSLSASPSAQLLDQRTRQFQSTASVTWQESSRLSFSMSGGFFAVDFGGPQMTSNVGYSAQADVNYRYTSRMTVGAYYSFTDYTYTKHEDVSDSNTIGLIGSYAFDRRTQLRLRGGISRIESLAYTQVAINPLFAALTGEAVGIIDYYHRSSISDISAQFVRDLGRAKTFNISYAHGLAPGNGQILTSTQQVISGSFSASLFHRYSVSLSGGRSTLSAQVQNTGSYSTNYLGLNLSRTLPRNVTASLGINYTQYSVTNMPGLQSQFRITSGISWGPGPGKLW